MRKLLLGLMLLVGSISFSQGDQKVYSISDDMSDKIIYTMGYNFVAAEEDNSEGMILTVFPDPVSDGTFTLNKYPAVYMSLTYIIDGVNCSEGMAITFKFEDGSLLQTEYSTEFNCDGSVIYVFSKSDIKKLSTNKIVKVKIQDKRSYTSYTVEITEDKQCYYFRDLLLALKLPAVPLN